MYYLLLPLSEHIDYGHGALGEQFEEAAKRLGEDEESSRQTRMPINFLYRHAVELFLKSAIITIHRTLAIPFGEQPPDSEPRIPRGTGWMLLRRVHGVGELYAYFKKLLENGRNELAQRCKTDWGNVPAELDAWIADIERADKSSTFFRYPTTGDEVADMDKSEWKSVSPEDARARIQSSERPVKAFLILDDQDQIVRSYFLDDAAGTQLRKALEEAADILSGAHVGLRMELAGGR